MRALVIGGTQFMGREVVRKLMERGHEVSVLHRRAHHDLGPDVENLQVDRADLPTVAELIGSRPFEAVFDFAYDWERGTTAAQVEGFARSCHDALRHYVFMSSLAAYGGGVDLDESQPLAPDDHPNLYVQHKATGERALFRMHEESGFPVTTVRPSFVHGPRQPFYREQFFWDRLLAGRSVILPDGGETPTQWTFVSDAAEVCVRAIEVPEAVGEAFNVGHVEPTTQRSWVEALAKVAGVEPTFISLPRDLIHAAGGHLFMKPLYFGEMLDLPPHASIVDKAERILDFRPTSLDAALREGFAWYQDHPTGEIDYAFEDGLIAGP
jgi:2'-hydroxyisoflavone reductase